ncbi:MAG: hypothetical protein MPL62_16805 [Alphaproteobacteria bacterium]|nr:hypothetical protein [Alphaproteobacteria bacterium]
MSSQRKGGDDFAAAIKYVAFKMEAIVNNADNFAAAGRAARIRFVRIDVLQMPGIFELRRFQKILCQLCMLLYLPCSETPAVVVRQFSRERQGRI